MGSGLAMEGRCNHFYRGAVSVLISHHKGIEVEYDYQDLIMLQVLLIALKTLNSKYMMTTPIASAHQSEKSP